MLQNLCVLGWASLVVLVAKNLPANAGDAKDVGLIPGSGRSPGVGNGNPLQYSYMENSMGSIFWQATRLWTCKESDMSEQQSRRGP